MFPLGSTSEWLHRNLRWGQQSVPSGIAAPALCTDAEACGVADGSLCWPAGEPLYYKTAVVGLFSTIAFQVCCSRSQQPLQVMVGWKREIQSSWSRCFIPRSRAAWTFCWLVPAMWHHRPGLEAADMWECHPACISCPGSSVALICGGEGESMIGLQTPSTLTVLTYI